MKFRFLPALALLVLMPVQASAIELAVDLYYPPDFIVVESDLITIEGSVNIAEVYDVEVEINGYKDSIAVRDFVFSEEFYLDPGVNTIRVHDKTRKVFYADGEEEPGPVYKKVYGHYGLSEGCLDCHEVTERGRFVLGSEVGEICTWCHGDMITGTRSVDLESVHQPIRDGRCQLCHEVHLSETPALLKDKTPDCRECHEGTYERLDSERYVHGPLNLGNCRLCHTIHSSTNPALLAEPATSLCVQCHSEVAIREGTPKELMPHTMIPEGKCGTCHRPHSSNHPRMMREASSRICYGCHPESTKSFHEKKGFSIYVCQKCHDLHQPKQEHLIVDNSRFLCLECHEFDPNAAFTHEFMKEGGCFTCHSFHTSPLSEDVATLCQKCHKDLAEKVEIHNGIPVAESRCTLCHRPHLSKKRKLLFSAEHTPFRERDCSACHADTSASLAGEVRSLCVACHDEKDLGAAEAAGERTHPPFAENDCSFCHASHASNEPFMLHEPQIDLCLKCHKDFRRITVMRPKSAHEAALKGECGTCHDPHTSANPAMLDLPMHRICFKCHSDLVTNAGGEEWRFQHKPVVNGKCRLCHNAHSARRENLLKAPMPQGCRPCHSELFGDIRRAGGKKTHKPVKEGKCAACHDIHGSDGAALIAPERQSSLCSSCHGLLTGKHHSHSHSELAGLAGKGRDNTCLYCHDPHASTNKKLLLSNGSKVCINCHKL